MKIIEYPSEINISKYMKFCEKTKKLGRYLEKTYGSNRLEYFKLLEIYKLMNPKRKTILDLGCGSINSSDSISDSKIFEPWLGRALYKLGANYIGIDIKPLNEKFTSYEKDLSNPNSLEFLKTNSIDIACAYSFFDSPTLINQEETYNILIPQLERIIKKEGYFIIDKPSFIKIRK